MPFYIRNANNFPETNAVCKKNRKWRRWRSKVIRQTRQWFLRNDWAASLVSENLATQNLVTYLIFSARNSVQSRLFFGFEKSNLGWLYVRIVYWFSNFVIIFSCKLTERLMNHEATGATQLWNIPFKVRSACELKSSSSKMAVIKIASESRKRNKDHVIIKELERMWREANSSSLSGFRLNVTSQDERGTR